MAKITGVFGSIMIDGMEMIKNDKRLDLIVCDVCKKEFENNMEGYEISRIKYNEECMVFGAVKTKNDPGWFEDLTIRRVIRFHEECFEEIAGDSFKV